MGGLAIPMDAWALLAVKDDLTDTLVVFFTCDQGQHQFLANGQDYGLNHSSWMTFMQKSKDLSSP